MPKLTTFDNKAQVIEFRNAVLKALEGVEKEYGIKVDYRGGKYDKTKLTSKFEFTIVSPEASKESANAVQKKWDLYAPMYGLKASDFGKSFPGVKGGTMTIIDINTRRSKYPIVAKSSLDGKSYIFPDEFVKRMLDK